MTAPDDSLLDVIGPWSELKLSIIKDYAAAYSTILTAQKSLNLYHVYIDAFAGAGQHISKKTGEVVPGSPLNALQVEPRFREYHFIDLDDAKVAELERISAERSDVHIYHGDCNDVLLTKIFPQVQFKDYRRGLCLLDPYGIHLSWDLIQAAADSKSIEIFLNFPIMDINRNVLKKNPEEIDPRQAARLTALWGDESWREIAYSGAGNLFGWDEKTTNKELVEGFCERPKKVAGFKHVTKPFPMRNKMNADVFYLCFASHNEVGAKIARAIFKKHSSKETR